MTALLLIPILVSGFIYSNRNYSIYYRLHRMGGQFLYLRVLVSGFILYLLSLFFSYIYYQLMPILSFISIPLNLVDSLMGVLYKFDVKSYESAAFLIFSSILSIMSAYLLPLLFGYRTNPKSDEAKAIKESALLDALSDSPFDIFLYNAAVDGQKVLVTLVSNKVYVGHILSPGEPNETDEPNQEISLTPFYSGVRKENGTIDLTHFYEPKNYEGIFRVVIPQSSISHVSNFDFNIYTKLKAGNTNIQN